MLHLKLLQARYQDTLKASAAKNLHNENNDLFFALKVLCFFFFFLETNYCASLPSN